MWKRFRNIDPQWKAYALAGCVCVLFFTAVNNLGLILGTLGYVLELFKPVILGGIMAYVVYPFTRLFDRHVLVRIRRPRLRWGLSVLSSLIVVFTLLSILMATLIPRLIVSISSLLDNVGTYAANLMRYAETLEPPLNSLVDQLTEFLSDAEDPLSKLGLLVKNNLMKIIETTTHIGTGALSVLIGAIIAVYLLFAKLSIKEGCNRLLKLLLEPEKYERTLQLAGTFNDIFMKFISCELLDALIVGGANFLFMIICRMPNPLVISVLIGITNLAPTFGPLIGAAAGGFLLLLVDPASVLPFLIFTVVVQIADAYLIKPRMFGGALNVPGVLILIAIIVFGRLWGVVGVLVAIPAAAVLVYIYQHMLLPYLEKKRELKQPVARKAEK